MTKKPIGYSLGDDYSLAKDFGKPVSVKALSPQQAALKERIHIASQTYTQTKHAYEEAEEALEDVTEECKHPVFSDEGGFIYDIRTCVICGRHIDSI